jgi:TolB-like protein/DNA-binding winged helix-turn-helix (wHTH) protein/Flp pilus assembly protein TadD
VHSVAERRFFEFGRFRLDQTGRLLFCGDQSIPLPPKAADVLLLLVQNAGNVVEKEQLLKTVWPEAYVEEGSLARAISLLRKALEEGGNGREYIATISKRGYRFVVPVRETGELSPGPEPVVQAGGGNQRKKVIAVTFGATVALVALVFVALRMNGIRTRLFGQAATAHIDSIAVLPLRNLSDDREQDYFADGMTDALITDLGKVSALRVISRTSVMRYKDTKKQLPEIARELQVDALVEGTVARSGDRVRITANLVQASPERHLWAETYERDLRDVIALQNDVARTITQQIQVELTPEEHARLSASSAVDPEAYKLYMKGRYFWVKRNRESFNRAMDFFQQAIDRDPSYAAPYSGIADCYVLFGSSFDVGGAAPSEVQPKAKAAALRALALDSSLSDAHNSLAYVKLTYDWDWQGAEAEFKRSLELNPGYAHGHHWYAHLLFSAGRQDEALAESTRALDLDPVSPIINLHLGWHYLYTKQYDRALEQLAKTLELDPDYALAHWYRGLAFAQKKMYADALRELDKAKELLPANLTVQADIGHVYAISGDKRTAERILAGLRDESARRYVNPYELALIAVGLGQKDEALKLLDQAFRGHSDMLIYLKADPRLDPIRSDSRFVDLVRLVGIPN